MDDNWFFRNRVRDSIFHTMHSLRELQLLSGIKTSEVFKIIAKVYRDTGGERTNVFLFYLIRQLEQDERIHRNR